MNDRLCAYCNKVIPRKGLADSHYKRKKTCSVECARAKYRSKVELKKEGGEIYK